MRSLGADEVIDYTREDFTRRGERWDVILVTAGPATFASCKGSLRRGGRLLVVFGAFVDVLKARWVNLVTDERIVSEPANGTVEDVRLLGELVEAGKFTPVIDRTYPLERIAEAHAYVDAGHKKGNVVITVGHDGDEEAAVADS